VLVTGSRKEGHKEVKGWSVDGLNKFQKVESLDEAESCNLLHFVFENLLPFLLSFDGLEELYPDFLYLWIQVGIKPVDGDGFRRDVEVRLVVMPPCEGGFRS